MKETLRQHAAKSLRTRCIVVAIILIASLVFTKAGIITLLLGGTPIDGSIDFDAMKGKQVTFDANYILGEYVRRTSTNTDTHKTTLTNVGYIVWDYENDALFGIYLPSVDSKKMDDMIDETWQWYYYEIDEVSSTKHVNGTLRTMKGNELKYFEETIDELVESDAMDMVRFYTIDQGQINGVDRGLFFLITIADAIALIYLIYSIINYATASYYKGIKKFLEKNSSIPESRIDADFASAVTFENKIWVGKEWTIYMRGMSSYLMENRKQVWAYYFRRTGRNSVSQIRFFDCEKNCKTIDISYSNYEDMLKAYAERQPQMLFGYDKDWEKTYKKQFQDFLNLRYNQAIAQMREENTYDTSQNETDSYFDDSRYNM